MIRIIVVALGVIFVCLIVLMMYCCLVVVSREDDIIERMLENEEMRTFRKKIAKETED